MANYHCHCAKHREQALLARAKSTYHDTLDKVMNKNRGRLSRNSTLTLLYFVGLGSLGLLYFFPELAARLGTEDGPVENATAFLFIIASMTMLVHGVRLYRVSGHTLLASLALLTGILFFIFAGEEISWGQRIFGIEAGEFMSQHNWQNETNLHNLHTDLFNIAFHYGAFAVLIIAPLFRSRVLTLAKRIRLSNIIEPFVAPLWLAMPSYMLLGFLDSRFIFIIEKPWAATAYLLTLAVGCALLLWQLVDSVRNTRATQAKLLSLSLFVICSGLFVSYVYAIDLQATNIISEYKELLIAACLLAYTLFWNSEQVD